MAAADNNPPSMRVDVVAEVTQLLRAWEEECTQPLYNPVQTLTRLAEIIEAETENYLKVDPDPFDERHPSRTDPDCKLGTILKIVFRKEILMTKIVNDYLRDSYYARLGITARDVTELNTVACRLMLDIMPGLEVSVVFQPEMETLIHRLVKWTTEAPEPLQTYATGLLAAAMEIPDMATKFRESNGRLVPLLLQRLERLQRESDFFAGHHAAGAAGATRPFAHFARSPQKEPKENGVTPSPKRKLDEMQRDAVAATPPTSPGVGNHKRARLDHEMMSPPASVKPPATALNESSNSSWAEMESFMIGHCPMHPATTVTAQVMILRFLTPIGEYQEFLCHVFEYNALHLILNYVNVRETKQARLAFEALRYLSSLLCHMKFSLEFLHCDGLQVLLDVPRPSIAATGVSICIYYLGYCEEAMERVCMLPKSTISQLVRYALWLLECSHDSGRCHATMFFGLTFPFKVILDEFDNQDGLRKLHNLIATLPILCNDSVPFDEDAECAGRQIVRHVCVAYKRYLEAHLILKVDQLKRSQLRPAERPEQSPQQLPLNLLKNLQAQPCKSPEETQQIIEVLLNQMPFRARWAPVDNFIKLGAVTLLLKMIAFTYEWNYSGRAETVRCALDSLAVACVMPRAQMLMCESIDLPEEGLTLGIAIVLGAAEGEIVRDADVQKSAIRVLINCVCGPIHRVGGAIVRFSQGATMSPSKKMRVKNSEELIQKVWDCVRSNSGIMVLMQLMNIKTPIIDADCIRTLACKAMVGLARCDTVRQIVSKLPIFLNGELQNLMRDPILQEKRQEHVTFQKYALELLGRLSGRTTNSDTDVSLVNIHRASVVAQTTISYNDRQLMQLIHQHLVAKGFAEAAGVLQREANLVSLVAANSQSTHLPSRFRYSESSLAGVTRARSFSTPVRNLSITFGEPVASSSSGSGSSSIGGPAPPTTTGATPIKLVRKTPQITNSPLQHHQQQQQQLHNSRLQKQISNDPLSKVLVAGAPVVGKDEQPKVTLDSIITEYLTNQHALCKNPMATCPQFNLFAPHKCPDPRPRASTTTNVVMRCARRQLGYQFKALDRHLVNSRFCPVQTFRFPNTDDGFFTCARFLPGDHHLIVGDYAGEVRIFNCFSGVEEACFTTHETYILNLEPSRNGDLLLSSSTWRSPLSALWSLKDNTLRHSFAVEDYVEFSKVTQDKVIGTKGATATVYDAVTGAEVHRFIPVTHNQYTKNKATFSYNDELILTDGVLFDVNSGQQIKKLDKLNQTQSGVFHPNGREIIANMEIWDMRTFHLLKTVQSLNQCNLKFAEVNNAIFAFSMEHDMEEDSTFQSSFKTVDSLDYSSIATIDVKRNIYDLALNTHDNQLAIVENQGMYFSVQESVVRLYDVGRRRDFDEQDEEDDDEDLDDDDDDEDDDGSDDASDASDAADGEHLLAALNDVFNYGEPDDEGEEEEDEEDDNAQADSDSISIGTDDTYTDLSDDNT